MVVFDEEAADFDDPCGLFVVSSSRECSKFDFVRCNMNIVMCLLLTECFCLTSKTTELN